jgi:fermentation-respiration switch protein FrsA (DUF1100 family)
LGAIERVRAKLEPEIARYLRPWQRFYLAYDPRPTLQQITIPVLAMNGGKDLQVPAEPNLAAIEAAFKASGNVNGKTLLLPGLNHLFQTAKSGLPSEYVTIEETFAPAALVAMGD